jgi:hypothetical protein
MGDIRHGFLKKVFTGDLSRSPTCFQLNRGRTVAGWVLCGFAVCGMAHVAIGADPLIVSLAIIAMALGIAPVIRFGAWNLGAVLVLLVAFRYVGFSLFAKISMGQALDTNLDQPLAAFAAVSFGVFAYFSACMMANRISVGLPLLRPVTEPHLLRRLSVISFLVGFSANLENALRVNLQTDAWNISNSFMPFLHLALISAAASSVLRNKERRILDGWTLTILVVEVAFAFVQNARTPIVEAVLALAVTDIAFRGRFTKKQVAITIAAFSLLTVITPVMLYVRGVRGELDWKGRIAVTVADFGDWREAESALLAFRHAESLRSGFSLRYYDAPTNVFERLSLVNHTDVLIHGADNVGHFGYDVIKRAIRYAMPRFLVPDKPTDYSEGDWIHYEYTGDYRYGNFLTSPVIGVGYASFGWVGVFAFPFVIGLSIFLLIKKAIGLNLASNIWAVYILISINNQFVEGSTWSNAALILRQLPQDTVVMLLFAFLIGTNRIVLKAAHRSDEGNHRLASTP